MDPAISPESAVHAEIVGNRIVVTSGFRDKDLIQKIPGSRYDRTARIWRLRISWAACVQLRGIFGDRLVIGEQLEAWAWNELKTRIEPCMALRDAEDVPGWDCPWLYPRQKVGALFMYYAKGALEGDEVGSGKTRQIIAALEMAQAYPAVVIAPKSVKTSWKEEYELLMAEGHIPERVISNVAGTAAQRRKALAADADVYLVHWEIARLHSRLAGYGNIKLTDAEKELKELNDIEKRAVVIDEGHRMQNPRSKQTRAVWALGDEVLPGGLRIDATGTPIERACDDAWPQFRFISPDEFPSKSAYIDRYALTSWNPFGFNTVAGLLPETKEEYFKIIDPRFIRRPLKVIVPWLPEPIRMPPRYVELTGAQKKQYEEFRDELITEVEGGILMAKNPLAVMTRLRQFASATVEMLDEVDPKSGKRIIRLKDPSLVLDELDAILEELGDRQALIFSESRQLMELAHARVTKQREGKRSYSMGLITGAIGEDDRTRARHAFNDGYMQHLGLTMGAGGEGLTLTAASAMIFIERSFSLKKNTQAEGRAVRPGQDERVLIIDIVPHLTNRKGQYVPTIYDHVLQTVVGKKMNAEEILRDGPTLAKFLQKEGQ